MSKINFNCVKCKHNIILNKSNNNISFSCEKCKLFYEYNNATEKIEIDLKAINNYVKNQIDYTNLDGCENWGVDG